VTVWSETDERVLRWVASRPFSYEAAADLVTLRDGEPLPESPHLEGLGWKQIDASLRRLAGEPHKFIAGNESPAGQRGATWSKLRIRAPGLQVLDEWPDFDRIASALGMRMLLEEIAKAESDPEKKSLFQRIAGIAGKFGDSFIKSSATSLTAGASDALGKKL
jgi:hypothetical protein